MDLVLSGGLVYDGTGAPGMHADVVVRDGFVVALGVGETPTPEARVVDVPGKIVAPGFVDIHTHSDLSLLSAPTAHSKLRQGVTTEVVGNCGLGVAPWVADSGVGPNAVRAAVGYLDLDPAVVVDWRDVDGYLAAVTAAKPAVNVATFVPHLPLHASVVGLDDLAADDRQLARLAEVADQGLRQGAVGISTGLVYSPLTFCAEAELMALGEVVAHHDRLFAWHVLDYADDLIPSVRQAISVARATGCRTQISHLNGVGRRNWDKVGQALAEVDAAVADGYDVAVDIYPYLAGNAPLAQLLPAWVQEGDAAAVADRLREQDVRRRIDEVWATAPLTWAEIVVNAISAPRPADRAILGKTVEQIATDRGTHTTDVVLDLLVEHGPSVFMVAYGRSDEVLRSVLRHPSTVVASDGQALDPDGPTGAAGQPHPRSYGCFPAYLSRYADSWADGIRRCTSAAADRVGLSDRGRIAAGLPADLVVLDPATLTDTATFDDPQQYPLGVDLVVVNGTIALDSSADTGRWEVPARRTGRALSPSQDR